MLQTVGPETDCDDCKCYDCDGSPEAASCITLSAEMLCKTQFCNDERPVFYVLVNICSGFYELVKDKGTPAGGDPSHPPAWVVWWAASTAGFLYWSLSYPTDVVKSAMQSDESDSSRRRFAGIKDCVRKLYVEDGGWRRFYRGLTPCLMRSIPANVTMLYIVHICRRFLDPYL